MKKIGHAYMVEFRIIKKHSFWKSIMQAHKMLIVLTLK